MPTRALSVPSSLLRVSALPACTIDILAYALFIDKEPLLSSPRKRVPGASCGRNALWRGEKRAARTRRRGLINIPNLSLAQPGTVPPPCCRRSSLLSTRGATPLASAFPPKKNVPPRRRCVYQEARRQADGPDARSRCCCRVPTRTSADGALSRRRRVLKRP